MRLFAFGSNGSGQLGIDHGEDVSIPTQCLFEQPEPSQGSQRHTVLNTNNAVDSEIMTIAAGGNHTLLLTTSGSIYAAGCNSDGRCGPHRTNKNPKEPESDIKGGNILRFRRVILSDAVSNTEVSQFKHVSATWEGTIAVASVPRISGNDVVHGHAPETEDRVFVLGSSPKGELGLGLDTPAPVPGTCIPSFPPAGLRITALASGVAHSVTVLSNGDVCGLLFGFVCRFLRRLLLAGGSLRLFRGKEGLLFLGMGGIGGVYWVCQRVCLCAQSPMVLRMEVYMEMEIIYRTTSNGIVGAGALFIIAILALRLVGMGFMSMLHLGWDEWNHRCRMHR